MKNFNTYISEKLKITKKKLNNNHNGHEYVDLELPSGTLWATCNVGADEEYDSGDYFAWGETYTKTVYGSATYKFNNSQIKELEPENDAAHVNMGGNWCTPTQKQFHELFENTENNWVDNYSNTGVGGMLFTGKNGNTLFFPANGKHAHESLANQKTTCMLWANEAMSTANYKNNIAKCVIIQKSLPGYFSNGEFKYHGLGVRGVYKK